MWIKIFLTLLLYLFCISAWSAATNLPDISVIGDLAIQTSSDKETEGINKLSVREIELALQSYLYPNIRADVFLAMHKHDEKIEPEICEAKVSFLRLFIDGLALKAGKIHVDFGKVNKIHQHERPYSDQPSVITNFLGEHGLVGEGAALEYLFPFPFFLQAQAGRWNLQVEHHHHEEGAEEPTEFSLAGTVNTGRLWSSFRLGENIELELGGSYAQGNGSHYLEHKDKVKLGGADLTLKFWPSAYKMLITQNELFYLIRDVPHGKLKRIGFYNYLGYQFNKYWDVGIRFDHTENALPEDKKISLLSAVITNKLTETTKIRLQYGFNLDKKVHDAALQLVFGMGPHSHPLQ